MDKKVLEIKMNEVSQQLQVLDTLIDYMYDAGEDVKAHVLEKKWVSINSQYNTYVKLYWSEA